MFKRYSWLISLAVILFVVITLAYSMIAYGCLSFWGYKCLYVVTGSMKPTINPDHLVLCKVITDDDDVEVGDIVAYKSKNELGEVIIHRVIDKYEDKGQKLYIFKGDNNDLQDTLPVESGQLLYSAILY